MEEFKSIWNLEEVKQNERSEAEKQQKYEDFVVAQKWLNEIKQRNRVSELEEKRAEIEEQITEYEESWDIDLIIQLSEDLAEVDFEIDALWWYDWNEMNKIWNSDNSDQQYAENDELFKESDDIEYQSIEDTNWDFEDWEDSYEYQSIANANDFNKEEPIRKNSNENAENNTKKEKIDEQASIGITNDLRKIIADKTMSAEKKWDEINEMIKKLWDKYEWDFSKIEEEALSFVKQYETLNKETDPNKKAQKEIWLIFWMEARLTYWLRNI